MKLVILTVGSRGDVQPYIALGQGLQQAGFKVTLATHAEFETMIRAHGLDFKPLRGNPRELMQSAEGQALVRSGTDLLKFARAMRTAVGTSFGETCDDCLAACEDADALILSFLTAGVGAMIAKARQLPTILAYLQPLTPTGAFPVIALPTLYLGGVLNKTSHRLASQIFWGAFRPGLEAWARKRLSLKIPRFGPYAALERQSLVLYGFSRLLVPRPLDWQPNIHVTGPWQLSESEFLPAAGLESFLAAGPKPLYIGFGSISGADPERLTDQILTALQANQLRGVLLSGWGGLKPQQLPKEVLLVDKVPHNWLFPRMAGVVHHAGAGTTHAGLWAGVPSLGLPFFGDQAFWAQRMFGMGAGPKPILQTQMSQASLNAAFQALSEQPRFAQRAAEIAQRMRSEGGVSESVALTKRFLKV